MRVTRDIQRVLDDERGVSIVFAMLLLVVLLILGGIILSYGYSGYRRATQDVGDEQAAYNVRSAAELVHGEFGDKEPPQWALDALAEAAGDELNHDADRTLSVQGAGATFANVTVRVKFTMGSTYDVAVFETDAMGADNRLNGVAYHFAVNYGPNDGEPGAAARIKLVGDIQKVGQ